MSQLLHTFLFGPYQPDQPDLYNPGLEGALNVIPRQNHFEPLRSPAPVSGVQLPSRVLGVDGFRDTSDNAYVFAGVDGGIYQFSSSAWNLVSKVGYLSGATSTEFVRWDKQVFSVDLANTIQEITLGGAEFADLAASIYARRIAVARDFVVVGDMNDTDTVTRLPNRVRWCAFRDPSDWIPSASTQADFRDLEGSSVDGQIMKILGGEFFYVFQKDATWRGNYEGPPRIFEIEEIDPDIGTIAPGSVVQQGSDVFFFAEDGFRVTSGYKSRVIGHQKINRDILQRLDFNHLDRITGAVLKNEQVIIWAFPGPNNGDGTPNFLVIYNYVHDRWAGGLVEVEALFEGAVPFTSFDDPIVDDTYGNLDNIPGSSDDKIWAGGAIEFMGINPFGQLISWTGEPLEATFTTGERQLIPGRRASVNELRALIDLGINAQYAIGYRNSQQDPVVWTELVTENSDDIIPMSIDARYMRCQAVVPAGVEFEDTVGVEVYGQQSGR